jgi:hypothetical protein
LAAGGTKRTIINAGEDGSIKLVTPSGVTVTIGADAPSNQEVTVDSGVYRTSIGPLGLTVVPLEGVTVNNPIASFQNGQWIMNDNQGNSVLISQSAGGRIDLTGPEAGIWINGKRMA